MLQHPHEGDQSGHRKQDRGNLATHKYLHLSCIFILLAQLLSAQALGAGGLGLILGPVKSAQCRQRPATAVTFVRSCVVQTLSHGDGPRHSLHASAEYREYIKKLDSFLSRKSHQSATTSSLRSCRPSVYHSEMGKPR